VAIFPHDTVPWRERGSQNSTPYGWGYEIDRMKHLLNRPYYLVVALIVVGMAIRVIAKHSCEWDVTYFLSARRLMTGKPLYYPHGPFVYPPFSALMSIPFALMPARLGRVLWYFGVLTPSLVY
jgi:hypothetical protein